MALPKIEPLSPEVRKNTEQEIKQEIVKLGQSIQKSATESLKATSQSVVGNVPSMIKELTEDIKSGSINNFAKAMNKLITLVDELGINLRDYNEDLADTVERFTGQQAKIQEELNKLREEGIKAEINKRGTGIKFLSDKEIQIREKEFKEREKLITGEKEKRLELQKIIENNATTTSARTKAGNDLKKSIIEEQKLRDKNAKESEVLQNQTADTGRQEQGFGKFQELKEAFMVIPDTIGEAMESFSNAGRGVFTGLTNLFKKGGLAAAFKGLVNFFKTARLMIMAKFLLLVAGIQFVAEKIDVIADFFKRMFDRIAGFFKAIGDWFANSWIGRKLGLGTTDDEETDKIIEREKKKEYKAMDEGTFAIGEDGAEIKDENLSVRDILQQNEGDASVAETVAMDDRATKDGNKKRIVKKTSSMDLTKDEDSDQLTIADIIGKKEVTGDQLTDGSTSSMLKSLETESAKSSQNSVINVQNNTNQTNSQSSATNVSGFIDHEVETSFKFVRSGNTMPAADF